MKKVVKKLKKGLRKNELYFYSNSEKYVLCGLKNKEVVYTKLEVIVSSYHNEILSATSRIQLWS